MRFAFIFMNTDLPGIERTTVRGGDSEFVGVRSLDEACSVASSLVDEGVGCIELCGAFGEDGARAVMEVTGRSVPVGYIVQLPELEDVCRKAFGGQRRRLHPVGFIRIPSRMVAVAPMMGRKGFPPCG